MYYVFLESNEGKLGYVGGEYFSRVQAQDKADEYEGLTHIIEGDDLSQAKRKLRDKLVKTKKDVSVLYKNVKNKVGV